MRRTTICRSTHAIPTVHLLKAMHAVRLARRLLPLRESLWSGSRGRAAMLCSVKSGDRGASSLRDRGASSLRSRCVESGDRGPSSLRLRCVESERPRDIVPCRPSKRPSTSSLFLNELFLISPSPPPPLYRHLRHRRHLRHPLRRAITALSPSAITRLRHHHASTISSLCSDCRPLTLYAVIVIACYSIPSPPLTRIIRLSLGLRVWGIALHSARARFRREL